MEAETPFLTYFRDEPDHNAADSLEECRRLFQRQEAIEKCLRGEVPAEYVLDLLAQQGVSPDAYVDCVESNVSFVLANNIPVNGFGLLAL
jgi:hypothetical protein